MDKLAGGGESLTVMVSTANHFACVGGSKVPSFNAVMFRKVLGTVYIQGASDPDEQARHLAAVHAAMAACQPRDEIEGMIAAQLVALHFASMECLRRSTLPDQPAEIASKMRKDGANMARTMTDMLDCLDQRRGKSRAQVVRVERVVVHEGGQAIVGSVAGTNGLPRDGGGV